MVKQVIGLVGLPGSGKNEVAKYLNEMGFEYFSLSDTLRNILSYLEMNHKRKPLEDIGDILRENLGGEVLARGTKLQIDKVVNQNCVVDGIRNPAEIKFLRDQLGAKIIGVTINSEKMFKNIKDRDRPGDPKSLEEFEKMVARELGVGESESGLQVEKCLEMADFVIENNGTVEDLRKDINKILT